MHIEKEVSNIDGTNKLQEIEIFVINNLNSSLLSVAFIAEQSHMSESTFFRFVKSQTGLSPLKYIREIKLVKSRELIEDGLSVNEAAINAGFNNVKYFSKSFKKSTERIQKPNKS